MHVIRCCQARVKEHIICWQDCALRALSHYHAYSDTMRFDAAEPMVRRTFDGCDSASSFEGLMHHTLMLISLTCIVLLSTLSMLLPSVRVQTRSKSWAIHMCVSGGVCMCACVRMCCITYKASVGLYKSQLACTCMQLTS